MKRFINEPVFVLLQGGVRHERFSGVYEILTGNILPFTTCPNDVKIPFINFCISARGLPICSFCGGR